MHEIILSLENIYTVLHTVCRHSGLFLNEKGIMADFVRK